MVRLALIYAFFILAIPTYAHARRLEFTAFGNDYQHFVKPVVKHSLEVKDDQKKDQELDEATIVRAFLKRYQSPLADYAWLLVGVAGEYGLDVRVMVAIAGIESSFCKNYPKQSHNCWGIGSRRLIYFPSFDEAIDYLGRLLGKAPAYRQYRRSYSIAHLGRVYCPPFNNQGRKECNTDHWVYTVEKFLREMEEVEAELR